MINNEAIFHGEGHAGRAINAVIDDLALDSLTGQTELLEGLPVLERVVFYGSSASGKSTIEAAIRQAAADGPLAGLISVPNRIVTRPARPDDVDIDHLTEAEFAEKVSLGEVGMHGIKVMEGGRREPFGISKPGEGLPVFLANNVIVKHPETIGPPRFLEGALLVNVYAPDQVREERLRTRSPQMFTQRPDEAAFRLSPSESAERMKVPAHVVVNNYGAQMGRTRADVITLLSAIA